MSPSDPPRSEGGDLGVLVVLADELPVDLEDHLDGHVAQLLRDVPRVGSWTGSQITCGDRKLRPGRRIGDANAARGEALIGKSGTALRGGVCRGSHLA